VNRLLKANCSSYWVEGGQTAGSASMGPGAIWIPSCGAVRGVLETAARELGVAVQGVARAPTGNMLKLKAPRIGLVDVYGGLMPTGWARWLFEQYEFPHEVIYPPTLAFSRCASSSSLSASFMRAT